ncbi:DUF3459 domain-containing protein [Chloroflexia bacterium SDU3-3]|nr:DUF3459 domain-containing protein [Chloroflexia bacterium SDU3-3]
MGNETHLWWQRGIIYQIYPRSYQDSNGDGVGDLNGIIQRLDYLQQLGVDAIWLSPIYPSPMADFGYDVADYTDVHPLFGSLADLDRLLAEAHARGLKIILDFVPNHSSDEHPWFLDARSSRTSAKRDWYIWRDPKPDGSAPNNWLSYFGGSAWEYDEASGQYYLHLFHKKQPDLNWRNPALKQAIYDSMRFWMERGVDGFRVDVIWLMIKDAQFRDNPPNPDVPAGMETSSASQLQIYTSDQPEVFDLVGDIRDILDGYSERVLVGEIYLPIHRLMAYYGSARGGCHMPYNFQLIQLPWDAEVIGRTVADYEAALPAHGWPNWVLGNHDQPRIASRVGDAQARVAQMLLLTLRGTPTMYYGDELGMRNVEIPQHLVQDPQGINMPGTSRDPERSPMQWDASPNAGFSAVAPWLPLPADYAAHSVAAEQGDPRSMLTLVRRLIALRRASPALSVGSYAPLVGSGDVLAYVREADGVRLAVALNLGNQAQVVPLGAAGRVLLSTHLDREGEATDGTISLRPAEGVIVAL